MTDDLYKPGFDGERGDPRLAAPERQTLRLAKPDLVRRLHDAMLTMSVQLPGGPRGIKSNAPAYIVEFSDRIGEGVIEVPPSRFRPTGAMIDDMPAALQLLDGLRKPFFKVVMLRALHEFSKEDGGQGIWPWEKIGKAFGFSERWAQDAYDIAIVQAARRSGILPMTTADYGILVVAVWHDRGWLTNLSTAADPRQALANLKTKSPIRIENAFTLWVSGQAAAKGIVETARPAIRSRLSHGSWFKVHPTSWRKPWLRRRAA